MERPPIADQPLSVVLPSYNARAELPSLLVELRATLDKLKRNYQVLVVDDASTDGSAELVQAEAATWPKLQLLRRDRHEGHGAALAAGLAQATLPLVFTLPAAAGFNPDALPLMLKQIDAVDLVVGRRAGISSWGWLGSASWWIFGLSLVDPGCPVRLYRRTVLERLPIQSKSAYAHVEILGKLNFLGALMAEVEVNAPADWRAAGDPSLAADRYTVWRTPRFRALVTA
jgi:glycosyltransferase involved in cell wall biosynthesis